MSDIVQVAIVALKKKDEEITHLRERLAEADECNQRVSDENEQLRQALTAILNDVGYHNPMRMTTEISDKVLFEAKAVLNEKIL